MRRSICGRPRAPTGPGMPGAKPQLPEPFTIERALPLMDEAGVDRVVVVPPSGLNDRNDYALEAAKRYPEPLRGHGPHSAAGSEIGRAAAEVEGAAGHARRAPDVQSRRRWSAGSRTAPPTGSGRRPRRPDCRSCSSHSAWCRCSSRSRSAIRGCTLIIDHMGVNTAVAKRGRVGRGDRHTPSRSPNIRTSASRCRTSPLIVAGAVSVQGPDPASPARVRRLRAAALPLGNRHRPIASTQATWRQRITHFTETLDFLSESDKDWVMGRAILERLKWA